MRQHLPDAALSRRASRSVGGANPAAAGVPIIITLLSLCLLAGAARGANTSASAPPPDGPSVAEQSQSSEPEGEIVLRIV